MTIQQATDIALQFIKSGRFQEAESIYRQILAQHPRNASAHANLALVLIESGRPDEAIEACHRALELGPDSAEVRCNLGNALHRAGRTDEGIAQLLRATELKPDWAVPCNNIGQALRDTGQIDEAIEWYDRALKLRPSWTEVHSIRLFSLQYSPAHGPASILQQQQRWSALQAQPLRSHLRAHDNDRSPDRRLRVGYVSADFSGHPVGRNVLPLLRQHDRQQFEVCCYASVRRRDDVITNSFRAVASLWRDIDNLDDNTVAQLIRADQIDVLVDLSLHSAGNRLLVFARKPAPVQITFGGYPGGTGLDTIDYRLTDPQLDPPDSDCFYVEKSHRLAETFWCYDRSAMELTAAPEVAPLPALQNGWITFGCLNNMLKINAEVVALWAKVLNAVPKSRLLLLGGHKAHQSRILSGFQDHRIDPCRIEFAGPRPREDYLALYGRIDIGVDTVPYNGHTTSLDSFWMGVPVVTLIGRTAVGRGGWSQLCNLNLRQLAAHTPEQFVSVAQTLAGDPLYLSDLRAGLRQRMQSSPIMDVPLFVRNVEKAYRQFWKQWTAT